MIPLDSTKKATELPSMRLARAKQLQEFLDQCSNVGDDVIIGRSFSWCEHKRLPSGDLSNEVYCCRKFELNVPVSYPFVSSVVQQWLDSGLLNTMEFHDTTPEDATRLTVYPLTMREVRDMTKAAVQRIESVVNNLQDKVICNGFALRMIDVDVGIEYENNEVVVRKFLFTYKATGNSVTSKALCDLASNCLAVFRKHCLAFCEWHETEQLKEAFDKKDYIFTADVAKEPGICRVEFMFHFSKKKGNITITPFAEFDDE